jgi:hypothetical protein
VAKLLDQIAAVHPQAHAYRAAASAKAHDREQTANELYAIQNAPREVELRLELSLPPRRSGRTAREARRAAPARAGARDRAEAVRFAYQHRIP